MFIAFFLGIVAGLRALTPIAAVSWAARLGVFSVDSTSLAFMGYRWTPWILTILAVAELANDKLPQTPSRKVPMQFATRIIMSAFAGLVIGLPVGTGFGIGCAIAGALGAVAGTLAGSSARMRLAKKFGGKDLPAALLEDCVAVAGATYLASVLG